MEENFIEMIANDIVRKKLNDVFGNPNINPDNLVVAISENISLWESGKEEIKDHADNIPGFVMNMASEYMDTVEEKYGGFTNLTLSFLQEDHSDLYSIIINTPNGVQWLDRQVNEILRGIGIKQ